MCYKETQQVPTAQYENLYVFLISHFSNEEREQQQRIQLKREINREKKNTLDEQKNRKITS